MAKPRITVSLLAHQNDQTPSVYVYLNQAGRDLLVEALSSLDHINEHLHLQAEDWTIDLPLRSIPYDPSNESVVDDVKIMFRLDEWDRQYFPHVMRDKESD